METTLWDELKLLQGIVDKIDNYTFQIKNWFLVIFAALIAYAVVNKEPYLAIVSIPIVIIFYLYELTYRVTQEDILMRFREVQELIRNEKEIDDESRPPNIDKYILMEDGGRQPERLLKLQSFFGVSEERARRNLREWKKMFFEAGDNPLSPALRWVHPMQGGYFLVRVRGHQP